MTEKRPLKELSHSPGPAAYNSRFEKAAPSFTMAKSARPDMVKSHKELPGPGQYAYEKSYKPQGGTISKQKRLLEYSLSSSPGPGAYNYSTKKEAPSFSLGGKLKPHGKSDTPGPGTYTPNKLENSPSYSIGVNRYRPESSLNCSPSTKPSPAKRPKTSIRSMKLSDYTPGSVVKTSPSTFLRTKNDTPGPGSYNAQIYTKVPIYKIGKAKRNLYPKVEDTPGPGAYTTNSYLNKSASSFGKATRTQKPKENASVGPGSYFYTEKSKGPSYSIYKRYRNQQRADTPGPGAYYFKSWGGELKSTSMVKLSQKISPQWSFAKGGRIQPKDEPTPGPGSYNIPSSIADVPSYAIKTT